ncbi:TPA: glycosyltransferase family 2 protein, partial [Escherichia coli]
SVDFVLRTNCLYFNIKGNIKKENIISEAILDIAIHSALYKIKNVIHTIDSNNKFDISIIIPVHNRENLIIECIKSINSQTLDKNRFEVIFIDDGSTDKSVAAIEYFIAPDINRRVIRREIPSGNASAPRNEGIKAAKGRYVFFLDSDDAIHSELLYDGLHIADKNNSDIVYFKQASSTGRGVPVRAFRKNANKADIIKNHLFRSLKIFKLFKRELLINNGVLFNPSIPVYEDMIFSCHALTVSNTVSVLSDKEYYILNGHDQQHLSKVSFPVENRIFVLQCGLNYILISKKQTNEKVKMFSAWVVICIEHLAAIEKNKKVPDNDKRFFFKMMYKSLAAHSDLINFDLIYNKFKSLAQFLLDGDHENFRKDVLALNK